MDKNPPTPQLAYIAEGAILEGATVKYSTLDNGTPGWKIHIYEPDFTKAPLTTRYVLASEAEDPEASARIRHELASLYRSCFP